MERVVKQEAKEEQEEEEVEVEEEQRDTQEPHVPPPAQVNMECQTDESSLTDSKPGSSSKKEEPVPPEGSSKKEESGERKQTFSMMTRLQKRNLSKELTMVMTSLETKMIQFFAN